MERGAGSLEPTQPEVGNQRSDVSKCKDNRKLHCGFRIADCEFSKAKSEGVSGKSPEQGARSLELTQPEIRSQWSEVSKCKEKRNFEFTERKELRGKSKTFRIANLPTSDL